MDYHKFVFLKAFAQMCTYIKIALQQLYYYTIYIMINI